MRKHTKEKYLDKIQAAVNFVNIINRNCREYIKYYTITRGDGICRYYIFDKNLEMIKKYLYCRISCKATIKLSSGHMYDLNRKNKFVRD